MNGKRKEVVYRLWRRDFGAFRTIRCLGVGKECSSYAQALVSPAFDRYVDRALESPPVLAACQSCPVTLLGRETQRPSHNSLKDFTKSRGVTEMAEILLSGSYLVIYLFIIYYGCLKHWRN